MSKPDKTSPYSGWASGGARNAEAMEALLRWLVDPKFIVRWEASSGMVRFLVAHLDEFANEYAIDKNVREAARRVMAKVQKGSGHAGVPE